MTGTSRRRWPQWIRRRTATEEQDAASAAETVLRAAVLLQAGVAPPRVWEYLAGAGDPVAGDVVAALRSGAPVTAALVARGGPWRDVAAAWGVAIAVGAPLAESLRGIAATLRDGQETADAVRVALAEPAGTARLMGWLPLVAVGLGIALGFDTLGVLVAHPVGIGCLVVGAVLLIGARGWSAALVTRAAAPPGIPGLEADLLAIALGGGVSIDRARVLVAAAIDVTAPQVVASARMPVAKRAPPVARSGAGPPGPVDEAAAVLDLSRTAGVPAVELLRAAAALARHRARTEGRLRAARLSSRLLLPLGVCTLPAFLLLGVAPMLLSVLSTTSSTF